MKSWKWKLTSIPWLVMILGCQAAHGETPKESTAIPTFVDPQPFAVVELYTSEG